MTKYKVLCVLLIVCVITAACEAKISKKTIEDIQRELLAMESYSCDVTMKITNNKSTMEYKMKHLYKTPSKYRIEVVEPSEHKGQLIICNGDTAWIYHPDIKTHLKMDNFESSIEYNSFIGSFIHYFKVLEKAKIEKEKIHNNEYYVLELVIPGENRYMYKEKLWISEADTKPYKIEIYDKDNKITTQILYENYKKAVKLEDSLFNITD